MRYCVPDFETVSAADLKKVGAWRYAEDITTDVLTLRWAWSDKPHLDQVGVWHPGDPIPQELLDHLAAGGWFIPHNAGFEKAIWRRIMVPVYGWPDIPNKQWDDSMARAANLVIPQELDAATRVLRLPALKDNEGSSLTIGLSKADKHGNFPRITPEIIKRVDEYCADDCLAQLGLRERIGTLSENERQVWLLDQRINERGFRIDQQLVRNMQKIVDDASAPMLAEFEKLTSGLKPGSVKLKQWCHDRGIKVPNLQKETIATLLDKAADENDYDEFAGDLLEEVLELPVDVRRALEIKSIIGSASIKKLKTAEAIVCEDGRARGMLQYHGAGPGLWAGRLLQPQNFPRGTLTANEDEDTEAFIERKISALMSGDYREVEAIVGPPVETVISSLRHIIIPTPGRELVVGDFAGIQARIALAAAGQHDKTAMMESGVDVYIDLACDIFNMEKPDWTGWDKDKLKAWVKDFKKNWNERRQYGKNSILGLGFQMGVLKFLARYCKGQTREFAQRIVDTYRKEWAPEVPKLWRGLEEAAVDTVWKRTPHEAYGVLFKLQDMWLTARLPSGRLLYYFNPQPVRKEMPWSTEDDPDIRRAWTYQARKMGKWVTIDAFGGQLTENLASALARDLLVAAMFKAEREGLPIVLTVHDEIVSDALPRPDNVTILRQIMKDRPRWAVELGIPVDADVWSGDRYRK